MGDNRVLQGWAVYEWVWLFLWEGLVNKVLEGILKGVLDRALAGVFKRVF